MIGASAINESAAAPRALERSTQSRGRLGAIQVHLQGLEARILDRKSSIAITLVSTLHLDANLRFLALAGLVSWVRVNTDEVVALIVWWSLVREDVSPHEMTHDEKLGAGRDDGESEEWLCVAHE
jgi:hypothetical protein